MTRIRILMIVCLTLVFSSLFAQDAELAKLLSLKDDTVKVQQLSAFAKKVVNQNADLSRKASSALLQISQDLHYAKGIAMGYSYLAFIDQQAGKHASASDLYNKAIEYYRQAKHEIGVAKCLGNMADVYESTGRGDRAIDARLAAVTILEKLLPSANSPADVLRSLAFQYNNFATTYSDLFLNNEKALMYLRKAESICRQAKDTVQLIKVLSNLSALFTGTGELNEALNVARETFALSKTTNDNFLLAIGYHSYGKALSALDRVDSAVVMLRLSLDYAYKAKSNYNIFMSTHSLAIALGKKGAYPEAIRLLENVLTGVAEDGSLKYKSSIEEELANAYFKTGNYKAAYQHLENRFRLRDSVIKLANNNIIAEKETKYQTAQKEKTLSQNKLQLAQKDLQLQKSRNYMYYTLGAFIVVLLLAVMLYLQSRYKKLAYAKELQSIQQQKELQLLQALMQGEEKERSRIAKDLHDGVAGMLAAVKMHFSSTASATELVKEEGYQQGMKLLNEATEEVRKTSHNLMPEVLLQHGLDTALNRYCNSVNNSRGLQIQYDSWGEIDRFSDSFELSVYRIVQELLNNIVKHSKATQAIVQLTQQNGLLTISIEDNGVGFGKEDTASDGMGLQSLQSRVKAMNGKIEMQGSEESGVAAYLEFEIVHLIRETAAA